MQKAQESTPAKAKESFQEKVEAAVSTAATSTMPKAADAVLMSTAPLSNTVVFEPKYFEYVSSFSQIIHFTFALLAIYLSVRANCGFSFLSFLAACCCPYFYIPYYVALYGFSTGSCPTNSRGNKPNNRPNNKRNNLGNANLG